MILLAVDRLSVSYGDLFAVREVPFPLEQGRGFVLLAPTAPARRASCARFGLVPARDGDDLAMARACVGLAPIRWRARHFARAGRPPHLSI